MSSDSEQTFEDCQWCGASSSDPQQHGCPNCHDWDCGSAHDCLTANFGITGTFQSAACKVIAEKGGWPK